MLYQEAATSTSTSRGTNPPRLASRVLIVNMEVLMGKPIGKP